jgi:hypothetical protein
MRIATGATADVPEPWASRFIADGTAVEVEKDEKSNAPTSTKKESTTKSKKGK